MTDLASSSSLPDQAPRIGPYRLLHEQGEGAFARTYLAEAPGDGRLVVLKVAHTWNPLIEAGFRQEFLLGSRLRHPHLGEVLDHGLSEAGRPFLVLAYHEGSPLSALPGPWGAFEIIRLGLQLARGLSALAAQQLVHRDLAPGNVLVSPEGHARLIDFGLLVPAGRAGVGAAGTPLYLAPEALGGEPVDGRADLYALGALLYRQACGQAPFEELDPELLLDAILNRPPAPLAARAPQLPAPLAGLIMRLLAKEPGDRPAHAHEVVEQLRRLAPAPDWLLAEGQWLPGPAWRAWESLSAAPGLYGLTGPAGSGLTRALQEAFRQVRRLDLPALLVAADENQGPYALAEHLLKWALAHQPEALASLDEGDRAVLAGVWPWAAPGVTPGDQPAQVRRVLTRCLVLALGAVAAGGRLAILIDDWEAGDPASRALLLAEMGGALGFCHWLVASRSALADARSWAVAPLEQTETVAWLKSVWPGDADPGLAQRLFALSGGNPGWIMQALAHLETAGQLAAAPSAIDLPLSVEATLESQFNQLSREQRALAELLALYDAAFAPADLVPISGVLPANWPLELPGLVARGVLRLHGGAYRFATGWWPQWVREQMAPATREKLATGLARALEAAWFPGEAALRSPGRLHRLARLYAQSGQTEPLVRYALEAGVASARLYANDAALAHVAAGLAAVAPDPSRYAPAALALRLCQADVLRVRGDLEPAVAAYTACLPQLSHPDERGRVLVSLGKCHQMRHQFTPAREVLEEAVSLLSPRGGPELLRALAALGRVSYMQGQPERSVACYEEALSRARGLGDAAYQAEALSFLGTLRAGQLETAAKGLAELEEALALREAIGDPLGRQDTHMLLGNAYFSQGRYARAREHFEADRQLSAETGSRRAEALALTNLALSAAELGLWQDARERAEAALALASSLDDGFLAAVARLVEGAACLHLGDLAAAEAALAAARERETATGDPLIRLYGLLYEAEHHLFLGRFEQARRAAEIALGLLAKGAPDPQQLTRARLTLAEAWLHLSQHEQAAQVLEELAPGLLKSGDRAAMARRDHLEGWICARRGDPAAAQAIWRRAVGTAEAEQLAHLEAQLRLNLHLLARQDPTVQVDNEELERAYALAERARTPELLALSCLGLALQQRAAENELLAERLARRGHELLALFSQALPSRNAVQQFLTHPARQPFCEVRELEEAHRLLLRSRRLEMLLALARQLGASRDPERVLSLMRTFTLEVTQAERCLILLVEAPGVLTLHAEPPDTPYSRTLVARVVKSRAAACVLDTQEDLALKSQASILDLRVRSVMCVPLAVDGVLHGLLYVDSRVALGAFTPEDLRVVEGIASQAAVALDNARLHAAQQGLVARQAEHIRRLEASDQVIGHLQELDRVRGAYFEAQSHDLRAPIGGIKAACQALLKGIMDPLTPDQSEAVAGIHDSSRRLMGLIDGILDGAALEAGKLTLHARPVGLARPIGEAIAILAPLASQRGLPVIWDEAAVRALPAVRGDERRLAQLVLNLLANALKFTEQGQVGVRVSQAPGDRLAVSVWDTGPGIPPERQRALFERYGSAAGGQQVAGSGLGLWLVKGLVDLHEGELHVDSAPGVGTTITVRLPVATSGLPPSFHGKVDGGEALGL